MGMITNWFASYSHHSSSKRQSERGVKHPSKSSIAALPSRFWDTFTNWLICSTEPRIWQKRDRYGNLSWRLYDPSTRLSATFASEDEVRIWLEERYSH
jgi:hypothetical protein